MCQWIRTRMHRGSRELAGSGPGPTDFGPFSAARLSRLREGGEAGCWQKRQWGHGLGATQAWPERSAGHGGPCGEQGGQRQQSFPNRERANLRPFRPGIQAQGPAARKALRGCPEAPEVS